MLNICLHHGRLSTLSTFCRVSSLNRRKVSRQRKLKAEIWTTTYQDEIQDKMEFLLPGRVQVTAEEYNSFYKATFKDFLDPVATKQFNVEGQIEFSALLFVPGMAPFEEQVRNLPRLNLHLPNDST